MQRFIDDRDIAFDWWQAFQSPLLNALVERALKNNPTIAAAQAALVQAQELVYAQRGYFFPTVAANYNFERQKIAGNFTSDYSPGTQGNGDNLQESSLTGRPNTFVNPACTALGYPSVPSKFSPTGVFQEPCIADFNGTLLSLDGNLSRNAGITPWTVFDDLRIAKRVHFGERYNLELIADMFNIANRYNVSAVSPLFTNAGQATAAYDPRQFQFAVKFNW